MAFQGFLVDELTFTKSTLPNFGYVVVDPEVDETRILPVEATLAKWTIPRFVIGHLKGTHGQGWERPGTTLFSTMNKEIIYCIYGT